MNLILNIVMALALVIGLTFNTLGVVGILRFPDVYTRLHADTKATTFGTIFTSLAVVIWLLRAWLVGGGDGAFLQQAIHTIFAVVVLAVTNATGAHAIARAAWHSGIRPKDAVCDALDQEVASRAAPVDATSVASQSSPQEGAAS